MFKNSAFRVLYALQKETSFRYATTMKTTRQIHCGICLNKPRHTSKANSDTTPALASKYQVITDTNSPIIENTAEEIHSEGKYPVLSDEFDDINLERKKSSYFKNNCYYV